MLDFDSLYAVLDLWPKMEIPTSAADGVFRRLQQVLAWQAEDERRTVDGDLMVLLRHVMRRHAIKTGTPARLRVPVGTKWPDRNRWAQFGIHAQEVGHGQYLLESEPFSPDWLVQSDRPMFEHAFAERPVRLDWRKPIDPFLAEASGFDHYTSPGQREAVRSAFLMPAGGTIIISLPTGSGKSFVAQAPVLARGIESGLTLCIVPTTALALDQARQTSELLKKRNPRRDLPPLAWHAGLNEDERLAVKSAIRESRQGILYCSPEAMTGALLPALYDASRAGFLAYLVIDEAHLLSQWGDGFRPAFQMLAGVRRGLLGVCPNQGFRTILMSATLTTDTIATIDALFGPATTTQMIASIYLRPEPEYWIHREPDEGKKAAKIVQAVRHAPRPLILYVTKRDDARRWLKRLRQEGFARSECFHGETGDIDRRRIISLWADNHLDVIVATSAFGVGIDKRDVRTVIHATVPETVDRFYQEVGRGGRDGRSSASLLVYSDDDRELAERLAAPSLISDELAFERWSAMRELAVPLNEMGTLLELDLDAVPERLHQQSDYNAAWNMRTLIMMARARMLDLGSRPPEVIARGEKETDDDFDLRNEEHWSAYYRKTVVSLLELGSNNQAIFDTLIAEERSRSYRSATSGKLLLDKLLSGNIEISNLLDDLYRSHAPRRTLVVSRACGGCPVHRLEGTDDLNYAEPFAHGIDVVDRQDSSEFSTRFPHLNVSAPILIPMSDPFDSNTLLQVLGDLVATFRVREISVPEHLRSDVPALNKLHTRASDGLVLLQSLEEEVHRTSSYSLARATVFTAHRIPEAILLLDRPLHVILLPASTPDPFHPVRRLVDTGANVLTIDQFKLGARS
jgi:superfamily II DNA helicase RecQ